MRARKWDNSESLFSTVYSQTREVLRSAGGTDVDIFSMFFNVQLDQSDYISFQIANESSGLGDMTATLDSVYSIGARK